MIPLIFCGLSLALFALSHSLVKKGGAYTRTGGDAYLKRKQRKIIGLTLLFPAVLLLVLALVVFVSSMNPIPTIDPAYTANPPYSPPVLPRPTDAFPSNSHSSSAAMSNEAARTPPESDTLNHAPQPPGGSPASSTDPSADVTASPAPSSPLEGSVSPELADLNARLAANPGDQKAHAQRGDYYATRKDWEQAGQDYRSAMGLGGTATSAKFDLADAQFAQKNYYSARDGFAALEKDSDLGDMASYHAFLCDLFGGDEDAAGKELDVFNQAGDNASFYFANVAWSVYHQKKEDARSWLVHAQHIYSPVKLKAYSLPLFQTGYLPLRDN